MKKSYILLTLFATINSLLSMENGPTNIEIREYEQNDEQALNNFIGTKYSLQEQNVIKDLIKKKKVISCCGFSKQTRKSLVMMQNGKMIGLALYHQYRNALAMNFLDSIVIDTIAVEEEKKSSECSVKLLDAILKDPVVIKSDIITHLPSDNQDTRKIFEQHGFKRVGDFDIYVQENQGKKNN